MFNYFAHLLKPQIWPPRWTGRSGFCPRAWLWWPCVLSPPAPDSAGLTSSWTSGQSLGCSSPKRVKENIFSFLFFCFFPFHGNVLYCFNFLNVNSRRQTSNKCTTMSTKFAGGISVELASNLSSHGTLEMATDLLEVIELLLQLFLFRLVLGERRLHLFHLFFQARDASWGGGIRTGTILTKQL